MVRVFLMMSYHLSWNSLTAITDWETICNSKGFQASLAMQLCLLKAQQSPKPLTEEA